MLSEPLVLINQRKEVSLKVDENETLRICIRRVVVGDMLKLHCDVLGRDDHFYIILYRCFFKAFF
jgi:hypothetical protein